MQILYERKKKLEYNPDKLLFFFFFLPQKRVDNYNPEKKKKKRTGENRPRDNARP